MTMPIVSSTSRKPDHLCRTKCCRNFRRPGRSDCHKCHKRKYRARHPIMAAYQRLKDHAKERGRVFGISKEYFRRLCLASGYHKLRGNDRLSLTVDRIDNRLGYVEGNIQILTRSENSRKGAFERQRKELAA